MNSMNKLHAKMSKKRAPLFCHEIPHDHFGDDSPVLLNIPQMQKPFNHGWQREIIYRHIGSSRNSEVNYITPCGKKLSCRGDVDKYLKTERIGYLSPDWFSFDNHVLVGGGDKEVSRTMPAAPTQSEPWRKSKWSTVVICTRYCPERNNTRPSLQCNLCKAFFHPECVFLSPTEAKKVKDSYVCTHCLLEENPDALKVKIKLTDVCPVLKLSFDCLLHILSYLPLNDLCSASCVCSMWNQVSSQPILWRRVSLHGLQVKDWDVATRTMVQFSTQRLDLRGLVHGKSLTDSWLTIGNILRQLSSIKWLDFGLVPTWILHQVTETSPDLEILTAEWISDTEPGKWECTSHLDFGKIAQLTCLKRLRLRAACGVLTVPSFTFSGGLMALSNLKDLTKLSLTTLKNVPSSEFGFLRDLPNLEELEIGECSDWDDETYECLGCLTNLKCLRLECGSSHDGLAQALKGMQRLVHLDLIMFGIPSTLADVLQLLPSLKTLSVWPLEDSTVNSRYLQAVCQLSDLYCLDWGVLTGPQASNITDLPSCDSPASSDVLSRDEPLIPIAPHLCSNLTSQFKFHKDFNNNSMLSLNELNRILCKSLLMTDIRVFRVPIMPEGRLYF
ncbi:uncharacterized protein [Porites lutea]|uniref:uncharacterized protein n=1 Tax=Porites lutea TaxID=51062 RepID=UPI003CC6A772